MVRRWWSCLFVVAWMIGIVEVSSGGSESADELRAKERARARILSEEPHELLVVVCEQRKK